MEIIIKARKKGVWSNGFDQCQCCETKEKKHYSKGLCQACYFRAYRDAVKIRNEKNRAEIKRMIDAD